MLDTTQIGLYGSISDGNKHSVKPVHPPHAASMPAVIQSPPPARNDCAIAIVSRPWQADQLAAKSRKTINSVSPGDRCLQLPQRFLFVRGTQNSFGSSVYGLHSYSDDRYTKVTQ